MVKIIAEISVTGKLDLVVESNTAFSFDETRAGMIKIRDELARIINEGPEKCPFKEHTSPMTNLFQAMEKLLIAVEPIRFALRAEIDRQVKAKEEWAKIHNATCGNSNEMWFYSAEFRRALEAENAPFEKAVIEANEVFDQIEKK